MSYNPSENYSSELRNPSGIVFFGKDPSKVMLDSSSSFSIDEDNSQIKVPNLVLSNGKIGTVANTGLIDISSNVTIGTGLVVDGDLTVNGTTVTVNTETVTIDDNILVLNNNATGSATEDAGIEVERGSDTNVKLIWDEGNNYWSISDTGGVEYEIASRTGVQTLLNKTISGSDNTLTNIGNGSLVNSTIGVNAGNGLTGGATVSLGGSTTINAVGLSGIGVAPDYIYISDDIITSRLLMPSGDVDGGRDQILIYDSGVGLKRITGNDFIAGLDILTSFNVTDGTNTSSLDRDEALTFAGGDTGSTGSGVGITPVVSTVNNSPVVTLNINNDIIMGRNTANFDPGDFMLFFDSDSGLLKRVSHDQLVDDIADAVSGVSGGTLMSYWVAYDDRTPGDDSNIAVVDNLTSLQFLDASGIDVTVDGIYKTVTVGLQPTSVSTGTYGSASTVGQFTVDQNGRLTSATGVSIQIATSQVTNFASNVESTVFTDSNFIDGVGFDFGVSVGASVSGAVRYDNSTIGINGSNQLYVPNGGIDRAQLAADAVDGTKIADDSINSEHYVDGSIDTVHIGNNQVTNGKLQYSWVSYGGVQLNLGESDATPAFNLVDATGYKSSNLVTSILQTSVSVAATGADVYLCTGGSGGITLTLPVISGNAGKKITIKKIDSGPGQIIIDGNGSETIDGALTKRLYYQHESMTLVCHTGATPGWYII